MESYIEISWITIVLSDLLAYYCSICFSLKKSHSAFFYVFFFFSTSFAVLCYDNWLYPIYYLCLVGGYWWLFYPNIRQFLLFVAVRYLLFFTYFKLWGGSFHLLVYFVPLAICPFGVWILLLFFLFVIKKKWMNYLKVSDFIVSLVIYADKQLKVRGYMDSGNHVMHQNRPVLFLDKSYRKHFLTKQFQWEKVAVTTLNKTEWLNCTKAEIKIERYKKCLCFICLDKDVKLEWGCRCLLNIEM